MSKFITAVLLAALAFGSSVNADTFRHKQKDLVYTGYATSRLSEGKTEVVTSDGSTVALNLAEYDIEWNEQGRGRFVSILPVQDAIEHEIETAAFEKALIEEADKGPLYVVIEIDSPGGRVDFAKRMCSAVSGLKHCKTVAFIKGGANGGAYSAAAILSLACDEIFMVPETSIGAATMIASTASGRVLDMKEAYGETVGEKFNSAWRTYVASIAEENGRPGILAKAMADKEIVVLEVERNGKKMYLEKSNPGDTVLRTVCKKGELLTLTAQNAVSVGLCRNMVDSRQELLVDLACSDAACRDNDTIAQSRDELEKVVRRFDKLKDNIDLKLKELSAKSRNGGLTRSQAIRDFAVLIRNGENLLKLKRSYPDIPVDEEQILELVNIIKAEQASVKAMR